MGTFGPYIIPMQAAEIRTPIDPSRKARGMTGVHTNKWMCVCAKCANQEMKGSILEEFKSRLFFLRKYTHISVPSEGRAAKSKAIPQKHIAAPATINSGWSDGRDTLCD
jgi:hypothetical protein